MSHLFINMISTPFLFIQGVPSNFSQLQNRKLGNILTSSHPIHYFLNQTSNSQVRPLKNFQILNTTQWVIVVIINHRYRIHQNPSTFTPLMKTSVSCNKIIRKHQWRSCLSGQYIYKYIKLVIVASGIWHCQYSLLLSGSRQGKFWIF